MIANGLKLPISTFQLATSNPIAPLASSPVVISVPKSVESSAANGCWIHSASGSVSKTRFEGAGILVDAEKLAYELFQNARALLKMRGLSNSERSALLETKEFIGEEMALTGKVKWLKAYRTGDCFANMEVQSQAALRMAEQGERKGAKKIFKSLLQKMDALEQKSDVDYASLWCERQALGMKMLRAGFASEACAELKKLYDNPGVPVDFLPMMEILVALTRHGEKEWALERFEWLKRRWTPEEMSAELKAGGVVYPHERYEAQMVRLGKIMAEAGLYEEALNIPLATPESAARVEIAVARWMLEDGEVERARKMYDRLRGNGGLSLRTNLELLNAVYSTGVRALSVMELNAGKANDVVECSAQIACGLLRLGDRESALELLISVTRVADRFGRWIPELSEEIAVASIELGLLKDSHKDVHQHIPHEWLKPIAEGLIRERRPDQLFEVGKRRDDIGLMIQGIEGMFELGRGELALGMLGQIEHELHPRYRTLIVQALMKGGYIDEAKELALSYGWEHTDQRLMEAMGQRLARSGDFGGALNVANSMASHGAAFSLTLFIARSMASHARNLTELFDKDVQ